MSDSLYIASRLLVLSQPQAHGTGKPSDNAKTQRLVSRLVILDVMLVILASKVTFYLRRIYLVNFPSNCKLEAESVGLPIIRAELKIPLSISHSHELIYERRCSFTHNCLRTLPPMQKREIKL